MPPVSCHGKGCLAMTGPIEVFIDIAGMCNLRCPSCPVGNTPHTANRKQVMQPEALEKIVAKMSAELNISKVHLYNWGEPFLHPDLPAMIKIAKKLKAPCHLSTNLNVINNLEPVVKCNPDSLRISLSGFNQATYSRTHRGGNIETVKQNMRELSNLLSRQRSPTRGHVFFHRYRHNLDDEAPMKRLSRELGFGFHPVWALLMPVEKVLACVDPDSSDAPIAAEDRSIIQMLALPLPEALSACRKANKQCGLPTGQMVIDSLGQVQLCCAVYNADKFTIGPYLDMPAEEIQRRKSIHRFCAKCMKYGIHVYETFGTVEMDLIAAHNIDPRHARAWHLRREIAKKIIFHRVIPERLRQSAYDFYCLLTKY